ncbi:Bgt-3539 [Blumeria graminis f. sp. tritici]|uniref:Bgt-3539 n=2 Tax=Blumeria graminis f. sp. tritici TaxID=62690 RepID=A0A9X9MFZ9_BLUGR|nr:Phosphatidylinositol 35-bisphosphate-binding protein [Blumeria graminis f. sp. tritici 96224]VDB85672.1 Bgt-3539 [Blumeria graminis f. sp. tritici]
MNVRPAIDSTTYPAALSVSFNQDSSCFSVGMDSGFSNLNAGIHYVQMLGKTNFIALIGNGKSSRFPQNKVGVLSDERASANQR